MSSKSKRGKQQLSHNRPQVTTSLSYQGPVPPPGAVEAYNRLSPELGTNLVREFTNETEHRREIEKRQMALEELKVEAEVSASKKESSRKFTTAMVVVFLFAIFMIGGGYLVFIGRSTEGWISIGTTIATVIAAMKAGSK